MRRTSAKMIICKRSGGRGITTCCWHTVSRSISIISQHFGVVSGGVARMLDIIAILPLVGSRQ